MTMLLSMALATFVALVSCQTASSASSAAVPTYTVNLNPGPGDYPNITSAIAALPADSQPKVIFVRAGVYTEQISITRNGKVTLIGETSYPNDFTQNQVTVQFSNGQLTSAGKDESTPVIYSKKSNDNSGLAVYNMNFNNTYPQTVNTAALAVDFYGQNMAAYGCSFIGYQDTLLANKGLQVFSNSYIEGSIDFIWGFSTAYFRQCYIAFNTPGGCISAQSRSSATVAGGYVFDTCLVTYTSKFGTKFQSTYLGRPYSNFSIAVYMNSYLDQNIAPAGWSVWQTNNPQTSNVTFGEYNNIGPGSWQANTSRASFATNFTAMQASAYQLSSWVGNTSWLDMTAYNYLPSYNFDGSPAFGPISPPSVPTSTTSTSAALSTSSSVSTTSTSPASATSSNASIPVSTTTMSSSVVSTIPNATSSSTSTVSIVTSTTSTSIAPSSTNAHPISGTVPPAGTVIVDVTGTHAGFTNLTAALASLPADTSNQTIFMYAGTYNEQTPGINRPGPTRIIGYIFGKPGQSYEDNTVVLTWSRGLSVSPLPSGHSDAETSTFTATSNTIALYNIDIVNTDNLNGTIPNYVTLAGSIYASQIGFYGCSLIGWQDTLLTGTRTGYQYFESSYIEGAIDFIWGYSKAYFKGCTIAGKHSGSCMTAQSRLDQNAIGGYIFDQCLFTAAPDVTVDLTNKMYLGRPYDSYAVVVVKYSYIDSIISPSGWKIWSATSPNTDHILFGEYNNTGPSAWQYNVAARQAFGNATLLTSDSYTLDAVMNGTYWIDFTYWSSILTPQPHYVGEGVPIVTVTASGTNYSTTSTTLPASTITITSTILVTSSATQTFTGSTSTITISAQSTSTQVATVTPIATTSTGLVTSTATSTATAQVTGTTTVASSAYIYLKTTITIYTTAVAKTVYQTERPGPTTTTLTIRKTKVLTIKSTITCISTLGRRDLELQRRQAATITVTYYTTVVGYAATATYTPGFANTTSTLTVSRLQLTTTTVTPIATTTSTSVLTVSTTTTLPASTALTTSTVLETRITTATPSVSLLTVSATTTVIVYTKTIITTSEVKPTVTSVITLIPDTATRFTTTTSTEEVVVTVTQRGAKICSA